MGRVIEGRRQSIEDRSVANNPAGSAVAEVSEIVGRSSQPRPNLSVESTEIGYYSSNSRSMISCALSAPVWRSSVDHRTVLDTPLNLGNGCLGSAVALVVGCHDSSLQSQAWSGLRIT